MKKINNFETVVESIDRLEEAATEALHYLEENGNLPDVINANRVMRLLHVALAPFDPNAADGGNNAIQ